MSTILFNTDDFRHPADGWYQIEAKGEHPNRAAGVVQVIDDTSIKSIVSSFNADAKAGTLRQGHEALVDIEHFKDQPDKETRAYGWLQELQARSDGIYGRIRWTATGQAAVDGGDYRFFSTEYNPGDCAILNSGSPQRLRPLKLDGLTLTNMNNNRGQKAITNREVAKSDPVPTPAKSNVRTLTGANWNLDQRTAAQMFSEVVRLVRNRIGGTFDEAYRKVLPGNRDLFEPGYDRIRCAQGFGRMLNRRERQTGLSPGTVIERSANEIGAMMRHFSPAFASAPAAFQWDILNRAAEVLGRSGEPSKIYNRVTTADVSAADAASAKANAGEVMDYLTHNLETVPNDIGAMLQAKSASARQIWPTFYSQVKKLMTENGISAAEAFNKLKDEQPLFWTMAMLSFENGVPA